jgi:hypothetical protein
MSEIRRCRFLACSYDPEGQRPVKVFAGLEVMVDLCQFHMNLVDMGTPVEPYVGLQLPGAAAEKIERRGHWASEHTKGTGHASWFVVDQDREPVRDYSAEVLVRMARHDVDVRTLRGWNEALRQGGIS